MNQSYLDCLESREQVQNIKLGTAVGVSNPRYVCGVEDTATYLYIKEVFVSPAKVP